MMETKQQSTSDGVKLSKAVRGPSLARASPAVPQSSANNVVGSFITKPVFTLDKIKIPEKLVFDDYKGSMGATKIDMRGWVVGKALFTKMTKSGCKQRLEELRLDETIGLTGEMLEIIRGFQRLRKLTLRGTVNINFNMAQLLGSFPKLMELDISECTVDIQSLTIISQSCQMLNALILQNCRGLDDFCMQILAQFMQRFRRLKVLDFSKGNDFGDEGMLAVLQAAPKLLSSLSLSGAKNLTSLSITGLRTRMPALTSLDVSRFPHLTQTAFEWIAEGCRALVVLDLTKSAEFDDAALIKIGASCPHLERLYASKCPRVTDVGVAGFMKVHQGRLKVLDLTACIQCGGVAALALAQKAEELLDLKLNGLSQMSAAGLLALWSGAPKLLKFEMAVEMRTAVTHRKSMLPHISDEILIKAQYSSLRDVHLTGACLVGDAGACALVSKCPNLVTLDLSYCGEITDMLLYKLAETLPLTFLALLVNGCSKVHDEGIVALSRGCTNLKQLEISGCFKVSDIGMRAVATMKRLETLAISNCDSVNTEAVVAIAQGCIFLKSVEFSGLDLVDAAAVKAFTANCPNLTHLTCDNCNFKILEFIEATKHSVALAAPATTRCALVPLPRPIIEHNKYVLRICEMDKRVRILQRFCKAIAVRTRSHRHHNMNKRAVVDIRTLYLEYKLVKGKRKEKLWNVLKKKAAFILTRWLKKMSGVMQNRKKVHRMRRRHAAALLIQRCYRGHMGYSRVWTRFQRLYRFYNKIGHLVWKYMVIVEARKTHKLLLKAQSIGRMFPPKLNYWLYRRAIMTLQVRFLNYYRRKKASARLLESIVSKLERKEVNASFIQKNWRIRCFNKQMAPYVFFCCIVWRSRQDERDWRLVMLQAWYRGSIQRLKQWRLDQVPIRRNGASTKIARIWWGYTARRFYASHKRRLKSGTAFWRRVTQKCCALRLGKYSKPFQRGYKLHYFRLMRDRGASNVQRVYRGHRGRVVARALLAISLGIHLSKVQRQYRRYKGRRLRKLIMAIEHMAAWRIQRKIHGFFNADGKRRIQAATAARKRREVAAYKRQLLVNKWTASLVSRRNGFMNLYAGRIQRRFRNWSRAKYFKEAAKEKMAQVKAQIEEELEVKRKNRFLAAIPNPIRPAIRMASAAFKQLAGAPVISTVDEPRLFNAVLKFHTASIVQVGIVNMKLSIGEIELKMMENQQLFLKAQNKPCYELVDGDLSGLMRLHMRIWIMRGTGPDCYTRLAVDLKPLNTSMPQLRSREASLAMKGEKITWHQHCHIELQGKQTIKQGLGGFAISEVKIVLTDEEGDNLKDDGYVLCAEMSHFGLPSFLWTKVREPLDDSDMYRISKIKSRDWCDKRLLKTLYTFNLSESDVLTMRKVFDTALGSSTSELLRVTEMFKFFGFEDGEVAKWLVAAVKPRRVAEVSFSEYVHIVCYFSMLGSRDLRRFVFGCMDVDQLCYLKRDKFMLLIEYISDSSVGNVLKWQLQYDKFKDRKLDSLFYTGFEKFTDVYRGVMWKVEEMQKFIRIKNLGVAYWDNKADQFKIARKTLGVKLI